MLPLSLISMRVGYGILYKLILIHTYIMYCKYCDTYAGDKSSVLRGVSLVVYVLMRS